MLWGQMKRLKGRREHGLLFIRMVREVPSNKAACEKKPEGSEQATKLREQAQGEGRVSAKALGKQTCQPD